MSILSERTIRLHQVGNHVPTGRNDAKVSIGCALRWIQKGVRLPDGSVVRLEAVRIGNKWITSIEALERFAERQTPQFDAKPVPSPRSDTKRQRAADRAGRELAAIGI